MDLFIYVVDGTQVRFATGQDIDEADAVIVAAHSEKAAIAVDAAYHLGQTDVSFCFLETGLPAIAFCDKRTGLYM